MYYNIGSHILFQFQVQSLYRPCPNRINWLCLKGFLFYLLHVFFGNGSIYYHILINAMDSLEAIVFCEFFTIDKTKKIPRR
jgi:hypothetical protein